MLHYNWQEKYKTLGRNQKVEINLWQPMEVGFFAGQVLRVVGLVGLLLQVGIQKYNPASVLSRYYSL